MSHSGGLKVARRSQGQLSVRAASRYATSGTGLGIGCPETSTVANTAEETSFSKKWSTSVFDTLVDTNGSDFPSHTFPHAKARTAASVATARGILERYAKRNKVSRVVRGKGGGWLSVCSTSVRRRTN